MYTSPAAHSRLAATQYSGRFILAYRWVALSVAVLSLLWTAFFGLQGNWFLAGSQFVVAAVAVFGVVLATRGQLARALLYTQGVFLFFIGLLCVVFDVPSADVPRVSHLFFLVLAMVGYLNFKRQPSRTQQVLIGASLVGFVAFASSNLALPFAMPISDEVRLYGAWVNAGMATAMLVCCVYFFQLEFERTDRHVGDLKTALWARQFELFYQPQVDADGALLGAEALLRWKHPRRGYVSPAEFIPLAETAGLMSEIGAWVLDSAFQTLVSWSTGDDTRHLTLSVNVSASQFLDEDFEQTVVQMLDRYRIDPTRLKLEITESVMMSNKDLVAAKMQILRGIGIGLALDDFGTGYSSLSYIQSLPLSQLKIDRSFVQDVTISDRSASLARSIVQLGRDLDLVVLAEGVETKEQFEFLRQCGCAEFQGYYFGRPVPLAEFQSGHQRRAA